MINALNVGTAAQSKFKEKSDLAQKADAGISISTAFNNAVNARFEGKVVTKASDFLKAHSDFLNTLTPAQLEEPATTAIGGLKEPLSWKDYKTQVEVMYKLHIKLEEFEARGTKFIRPTEPEWDSASPVEREYAAVAVLARNINMHRKGALQAAQNYNKGQEKVNDAISLSSAAVALMIQDADKYETSNSNLSRVEVKTAVNRLV